MAGLIGKTKKPKHGLLRPKEFRRIVGKAGAVAIRFDWFFGFYNKCWGQVMSLTPKL